jgi:L-ascorbate metabolism protein UlaG (beta-lactamase superfamily)
MKVRYLGHSCVEIIGQHHILIDPDFMRDPEPGVEYIFVSHAHKDHIARIAELITGKILASADVCEIAVELGVTRDRIHPVKAGDKVANINILPGFSRVSDPIYNFFYFLFRRRFPEPGGTPLSVLIEDEATLLHIGDAHKIDLDVSPDILCLPWRTTPFGPNKYKQIVIDMAEQLSPEYVIPIHHDLPGTEADPAELNGRLKAEVLEGHDWYYFRQKQLIKG